MQEAIDTEAREEITEQFIEKLDAFAVRVETNDYQTMKYLKWYSLNTSSLKQLEVPEDAGEAKYFYKISSYDIALYKERSTPLNTDNNTYTEAQEKTRDLINKLEEIAKRAYQLRFDFVKNYGNAKKHLADIADFYVQLVMNDISAYNDDDMLLKLLNIEPPDSENDDDDEEFNRVLNQVRGIAAKTPEKTLLLVCYSNWDDGRTEHYHNYHGEHTGNKSLDTLYVFLQKLGYEMSDEEKQMQDGSHELFAGDKGDNA